MQVNNKTEHVLKKKTPLHPSMSRGTTMFQVCFFRSSYCFSSVKKFIISYCQRAAQREMRKERLFRSHMEHTRSASCKKKIENPFEQKKATEKMEVKEKKKKSVSDT